MKIPKPGSVKFKKPWVRPQLDTPLIGTRKLVRLNHNESVFGYRTGDLRNELERVQRNLDAHLEHLRRQALASRPQCVTCGKQEFQEHMTPVADDTTGVIHNSVTDMAGRTIGICEGVRAETPMADPEWPFYATGRPLLNAPIPTEPQPN